jgi:hypothetical protein
VRLFGGISVPIAKGVRTGLSRRGTPWVGARAGSGPFYLGALFSGGRRKKAGSQARKALDAIGKTDVLSLTAERTGDGGAVLRVEFEAGTMRLDLRPEAAEDLIEDLATWTH